MNTLHGAARPNALTGRRHPRPARIPRVSARPGGWDVEDIDCGIKEVRHDQSQADARDNPKELTVDAGLLARTIEVLEDCANTCTQCADSCLSERDIALLAKCIRLNLGCADVCVATGRVTSRQTEYDANVTRPLLEACIAACRSCSDEWSATPNTWRTAACAPRAAASAERRAASSWPTWPDRRGGSWRRV